MARWFLGRGAAYAALLLASACAEPTPRPAPLLLVGIDGLDPAVCAELLAAGRLPNLARFAQRGTLGRLATTVPTYSPVIWTTIATGQSMEAHGIDFFHDAERRPYTSNARRVPALWNLVSDAGLDVDVFGWWVSWPAEPVQGRVVASYAAQVQAQLLWKGGMYAGMPEGTWPGSLQARIDGWIAPWRDERHIVAACDPLFPPGRRKSELNGLVLRDLRWTFAGDRAAAEVARELMRESLADLTMVYLGLPDVVGHRFWRWHAPEAFPYAVGEPERSDFANFVAESYAESDRMLGSLLELMPPESNVIVLSDHGMRANLETLRDPEAAVSGHHQDAPEGVFGILGPSARALGNLLSEEQRGTLGDVLGVAPLVLHLLELEVPEHWPRANRASALEQVLDEVWRREHALRLGPNRDAEFRPASPSRVPLAGKDQEVLELLDSLGYTEIEAHGAQGEHQ